MSQPILVLDSHYLCYRAFHSQGQLSYNGMMTGVIFGFLKGIQQLKDDFQTDRVAFCFEGPDLHRRKIYPDYKLGRHKNYTEEEKQARRDFTKQISRLQSEFLPQIGFKNIFNYPGFESDDVMAAIAMEADKDQEIILVTADSDMWQCLRENVSIYSPQKQKVYTTRWFYKEYGIFPRLWAKVKAISGCSSDNVAGIPGVGEKSALRYVQGKLKDGIYYQRIAANRDIMRRNRKLVELPYVGCPVPVIQDDVISRNGWRDVCGILGMRSIAGQMPVATRKLAQYARRKIKL